MVRNIDLPECVILYGRDVLFEQDVLRYGLQPLLDECRDIDTAVVALLEDDTKNHDTIPQTIQVLPITVPPPHTRDLLTILETITVQPRPFGGSSGFGSQPPDPVRHPLPQHCVVLTCDCLPATRAARACGMRVVSLCDHQNQKKNTDHLADIVLDAIDFGVDDIATPGSFWLNPPHPRDDQGNRMDPYYEWANDNAVSVQDDDNEREDMDDDELRAILADMAPLK